MVEKYEPYLIGVGHLSPNASKVVELILKLNVKSVGVEVSNWQFSSGALSQSVWDFWATIIRECEGNGIKVIFLTPDAVSRKIVSKEKTFEPSGMDIAIELANPKIKGVFPALVKDSMTRAMEKQALKEKPEAIVSGGGHAILMKHDFRIHRNKVLLLHHFLDLRQQIQGIKRFRTKRAIKKGFKNSSIKQSKKYHEKGDY